MSQISLLLRPPLPDPLTPQSTDYVSEKPIASLTDYSTYVITSHLLPKFLVADIPITPYHPAPQSPAPNQYDEPDKSYRLASLAPPLLPRPHLAPPDAQSNQFRKPTHSRSPPHASLVHKQSYMPIPHHIWCIFWNPPPLRSSVAHKLDPISFLDYFSPP